MSKEVNVKKGNFTTTYNDIFRVEIEGKKLTPEAWGLYVFMLSLPDNWDYTISGLTKVVNAGRDKIARMINELIAAGFITRERKVSKNNVFLGMEYTINEKQIEPQPEKPCPEKPCPEKPRPEKPQQLNTNQQSTKELSTNELNDKRMIKGEKRPQFKNHYLTSSLVKKKIIDSLDKDLIKFNDLFKELDNEHGLEIVLSATRYLIDYLSVKENKNNVSNIYSFIETSLNRNIETIKNNSIEKAKSGMVSEYMTEIQNMDAKSEQEKLLNKVFNSL